MSLTVIPDGIAAGAQVEIAFDTAVNPSESGINSRKSMRGTAIRTYTVSIGPDDANELISVLLANKGARYPVAIRDYADNYQLTAEPQTWTQATDGAVINLSRTFTPTTGTRTYTQRILVVDESQVAFQVFVNGVAAVSPQSWALSNWGVLTVQNLTSGDVVTVTGQYLVPCVFSSDRLTATVNAIDTVTVSNLQLTEILENELSALA